MNRFLKLISVMFIFTFFLTNVFADETIPAAEAPEEAIIGIIDINEAISITSITSDATEKGVLGIDETIKFTVELSRPMSHATIHPYNYNDGKLVWKTNDYRIFTAIYTVKEGHKNQETPLQLERVSAENGTIRTRSVSGRDVLKTIDATKPTATLSKENIIKSTASNFILLSNISEDIQAINIVYTDKENNKKETDTDDTNLSSLLDGSIMVAVTLTDRAGNTNQYSTELIKNTVAPVLLGRTVTINHNTSVIIKGQISVELKEENFADLKLSTEGAEPVGSECNLKKVDDTIHEIFCEFKELKDGKYDARFTLTDNYNNSSVSVMNIFVNPIDAKFKENNLIITKTFPKITYGNYKVNTEFPISEADTLISLKLKNRIVGDCKIEFTKPNEFSISCAPKIPVIDIGVDSVVELSKFGDGKYDLEVIFTDGASNYKTINQQIIVDNIKPEIILNGGNVSIVQGNTYVDAGATATDNVSVGTPVISGTVDTTTVGTYIVTYNVTDEAGNAATPVTRTVTVTSAPATGGGGGTRITPVVIPQPVVTTTTEVIPRPEPFIAPAATETPTTAGATGFLGLPGNTARNVGVGVGALAVIGAVGYFFFLRPR